MPEEKHLPEYARLVLVPLANPATAPALLELASALIEPEEGRILALVVSTGSAEEQAATLDKLKPIIEAQEAGGVPVKLVARVATSVTRGILDATREAGADLLILGVRRHGTLSLGAIVENVAAAAPCDVLIYRAGPGVDLRRVVIPANGSLESRAACRLGVALAHRREIAAEAIYAMPGAYSRWEGMARIESSLNDLPGRQIVKRTVITAADPASGILTRLEPSDLLVVGLTDTSPLERWLYGDFSSQLLNHAPGPVIIVERSASGSPLTERLRRGLSRFSITLTPVEQDEMLWQGQRLAVANLDFFVLVIIAATLASLGLLLNSPAVIIGAMLVAPLMQPLIAQAVGFSTARFDLIWRGTFTLGLGILVALVVAGFIGVIVPTAVPTQEMLNRTNPSLADIVVALASGFIGAYATARKDIPAALAGVAIAAALMPPLCVVGLNLTYGNLDFAERAALLFITNISAITGAAWLCFSWIGLRPRGTGLLTRRWVSLGVSAAFTALIITLTIGLITGSNDLPLIERRLQEHLAPAELVSFDLLPGQPPRLVATVRAGDAVNPAVVRALQAALDADLQRPVRVEVVVLNVVRPSAP